LTIHGDNDYHLRMEIHMNRNKRSNRVIQNAAFGALVSLAMLTPAMAQSLEYTVTIKNHVFVPDRIEVTAGQKHRLIVLNRDNTPEEFESYELNREKIVAGNGKIIVFLPALDAGEYPFFGEFNPATAQGRIVVK